MTATALVHQIAVRELQRLEARAWREDVLLRQRSGSRLLTLYGRRRPGEELVEITSVLRAPSGELEVTRTETAAASGYHALAVDLPAAHCFERELHEQTGVRVAGHPWLKPLRFEGQAQSAMDAYPFYKVEGKEVHEVAVGPIHAGVIEPGSFRFMCLGEQVHHLEVHLGYQHRGVERRLLERDPCQLLPWIETAAGDTSVAHAFAYCAAIERLAGCELMMEVAVARAVALELERVAMHLAGLAGMATDLAHLQGASTYGRLRTLAINTTMQLCGSRFGRGALRPGGIAMKLTPESLKEIQDRLRRLKDDAALIGELFFDALVVQHRLQGAGALTQAQALELGLVGLAARASGLAIDARVPAPAGAYQVAPLEPRLESDGDCWARTRLRSAELRCSLEWIETALALYGSWHHPRQAIAKLPAEQLAIAVVEGFRGEVVHCLETDASGKLAHYKVQDPSLRNWMGLAIAVRNNEISDFPICNKSFDLSYCGHDL